MGYLAREHPERRFVTVSPGNTTGTGAASGLPLPMRVAAKYVMPALGLSHKLDVEARLEARDCCQKFALHRLGQ